MAEEKPTLIIHKLKPYSKTPIWSMNGDLRLLVPQTIKTHSDRVEFKSGLSFEIPKGYYILIYDPKEDLMYSPRVFSGDDKKELIFDVMIKEERVSYNWTEGQCIAYLKLKKIKQPKFKVTIIEQTAEIESVHNNDTLECDTLLKKNN